MSKRSSEIYGESQNLVYVDDLIVEVKGKSEKLGGVIQYNDDLSEKTVRLRVYDFMQSVKCNEKILGIMLFAKHGRDRRIERKVKEDNKPFFCAFMLLGDLDIEDEGDPYLGYCDKNNDFWYIWLSEFQNNRNPMTWEMYGMNT